jgi:hypothetical protein
MFKVKINSSEMKENSIHYEMIELFEDNSNNDEENNENNENKEEEEEGKKLISPTFRIPITIIKPIKLSENTNKIEFNDISLSSGKIIRNFINVPNGSNFLEINIKINDFNKDSTSRLIVLHTLQVLTDAQYSSNEYEKYIRFETDKIEKYFIPVISERTIEVKKKKLLIKKNY